jgi:hypothetical protein
VTSTKQLVHGLGPALVHLLEREQSRVCDPDGATMSSPLHMAVLSRRISFAISRSIRLSEQQNIT